MKSSTDRDEHSRSRRAVRCNRMASSRWLLLLGLAGSQVVLSNAALAQGGGKTQPAATQAPEARQAEDLYNRGVEAARQHHWEEAFKLFTQAYALNPSPRIAADLGTVEHRLEHYSQAALHLNVGLTEPEEPKIRAKREEFLQTAKEHVATVRVNGLPDGAEVSADGEPRPEVTKYKISLFLDAGEHSITARWNGQTLTRQVLAKANTEDSVSFDFTKANPLPTVAPDPAPAAPPTTASAAMPASPPAAQPPEVPPPPPVKRSNGARTAVLITEGALAGVTLVAGAAFLLRGSSLEGDHDGLVRAVSAPSSSRCGGTNPASGCQALADNNDSSLSANRAGVGFLVAGGVLTAATVGTWWLWKPHRVESVTVRAVPAAGPGYAGIGFAGNF